MARSYSSGKSFMEKVKMRGKPTGLFLGAIIFISVGFLLLICHIGVRGQTPSAGVRSLINKLPCTAFEWEPWKAVSDKGAIKVPIKFGRKTYWFQLDTGSDGTIVYGKIDKSLGLKEGQNSVRLTNVELGRMKFPVARLYINPNMHPEPGGIAGTVGLDLFMGNVAVIDFPGKRFCLMPKADAPTELRTQSESVKAVIRDGKFFIETKLNGQRLDDLFYDSGSSAMALSVDFEVWKSLTGLSGEEQATKKYAGSSWGKPMNFIGGETKGELEIGEMKLGKQLAFYRSQPLDFFKKFPFTTVGNIGNAPFFDKVIILDLGVHPAFRIIKN
jgi:hypothetical protein